MHLIIDSHEDLAWNMATFQRDYTRSVLETRSLEMNGIASQANGDTMLGWPEYQLGHVAIVFATLFASPLRKKKYDWSTQNYDGNKQANKLYRNQLDLYHRLVNIHPDKFKLILSKKDLDHHISCWLKASEHKPELPVGIVILMEGAEAVQSPEDLEFWWENGVRIIGPAWTGTRFCGGTGEPGPLTDEGHQLLDKMAEIGFILDISHMDELAALQSLDTYEGKLIASHANASSLIKNYSGNRHLSDETIHRLFERDGVMGIIPYNKFLDQDWISNGGRVNISLSMVADQINHVCQVAGDAHHVGIGTDFDGGFGMQSAPYELNSIADLQKLADHLTDHGFSYDDISAILGLNWKHMLEYNLP
jgi:membrane dipeptidase